MRKHFSYANVVATAALVLSMAGGAVAASHYLIPSTKQSSPTVLNKLKGRRGPTGPRGPNLISSTKQITPGVLRKLRGRRGPAGPAGAAGGEGAPGQRGAAG